MKQSIGFTVTMNIVIVFLLLTFAFIFGIVSYSKAFRASSKIINAIEKNEGYNSYSLTEINQQLATLGYSVKANSTRTCPAQKKNTIGNGKLVSLNSSKDNEIYDYCIYKFDNDGDAKHYSYGITTYIEMDLGFLGLKFKISIYGKTNRIDIFG